MSRGMKRAREDSAAFKASYQPHTDKTASLFADLLAAIKERLPPGLEASVSDIAEDVVAAARSPISTAVEKRQQLEAILGVASNDELLNSALTISQQLDDFVASGAAVSDLQGDEASQYYTPAEEEQGDDVAMTRDNLMVADDVDDAAAVDDSADNLIPFDAVHSTFFEDELRILRPADDADTRSALSARVRNFLQEKSVSKETLEMQLTMCLDGWSNPQIAAWASKLSCNRWNVVYGYKLNACGNDASQREQIVSELRMHTDASPDDDELKALLFRLTGEEKYGKKDAEDAANAAAFKELDLEGLRFVEGERVVTSSKPVVPKGTQRIVHESYEEVILPPAPPYQGSDPLTPVSSLPAWARRAFPSSMSHFNPMQSKVFGAAFDSDENLLICAPTGAGKTNVAMLAILHELKKVYEPETDSLRTDLLKIVYVAPMKALVQEVTRTFGERLASLGVTVAELSGDQNLTKEEIQDVNVIVTTPEKWDIVTRKSLHEGVASLVRLIIIDEVHLLHNERGPVVEAIVARSLRRMEDACEFVRLVGLSATLPNYGDVAAFLRVDPSRGLFFFNASFRPVPLQQTFCALRRTAKGVQRGTLLNDITYEKVMQQAGRAQVLVFVHGRKDTFYTAKYLKDRLLKEGKENVLLHPSSDSKQILVEASRDPDNRNEGLKTLLEYGFAIHHAGMPQSERALVERLFAERHIQVLVCTSTLAWGVNLPAHAVIIKGTEIFAPEKGGWTQLGALDVLQMFGRAGRPGFDTSGEAAIITTMDELAYYLTLLGQQLPIESQFMARFVEELNAEIVAGSVKSIAEAADWLKYTYYYVRARHHPRIYGVPKDEALEDPTLLQRRTSLAHTACLQLADNGLITYDKKNHEVRGTELGRIASHFYLNSCSVKAYRENLAAQMEDVELLRCFSLSGEFRNVVVRNDEKAEIRKMIDQCPIAVPGPSFLAASKNQCDAAGLHQRHDAAWHRSYVGNGLRQRQRCAYHESHARNRSAQPLGRHGPEGPALLPHDTAPPVDHRDPASPAGGCRRAHHPQIGSEASGLGLILLHGGGGAARTAQWRHRVGKAVLRRPYTPYPRLHITAITEPLSRSCLRVELEVTPDFMYLPDLHGRSISYDITVEDAQGQTNSVPRRF